MIKRYTRKQMGDIWSETNKFQTWLDLELAVCAAHTELGTIPAESLKNIKAKAKFEPARIEELDKELHHETIAFLTNLSENIDGPDSRYVHLGMTSSDMLDTALSLQVAQANELLVNGLDALLKTIKERALEHKNSVCMGRSHGVHAEPTTFGLKLLAFYDDIARAKHNLVYVAKDMRVGMISGAVGSYANVDPNVEKLVCKKLGLIPAQFSTQVIARDRHSYYLNVLSTTASVIERIAVEIRHLQRTEVLEVEEPFVSGQKGSSAMPHKRNPWRSENLSGLARMMRSYAQVASENINLWHERDMSHSSTERIILPDAACILDFMIDRISWIISGLNIYPENMKRNMNRFGQVSFSQQVLLKLIDKGLKREEAYKLVQELAHQAWNSYDANGQEKSFKELAESSKDISKHINKKELDECFDHSYHLKHIDYIFDKVLN